MWKLNIYIILLIGLNSFNKIINWTLFITDWIYNWLFEFSFVLEEISLYNINSGQ